MSNDNSDYNDDGRPSYPLQDDDDAVMTVRIASAAEVEQAKADEAAHDGHGGGHGHGGGGHGHDDGGGHGGGHGHGGRGSELRQLSVIIMLIAGMILLHFFAPEADSGYDAAAMLALGFVVLACFTIGAFVDIIKLPHITGYLLAGIIFGPSLPHFIDVDLWPPFDEGVLTHDIIDQLNPLNTLAVALIALTAGGELKLDQVRQGLRAIMGVLVIQMITVLAFSVGFFWLVSGAIPALSLPGLGDVSSAWGWIGLTVGAVSFATSPAATVAIINETGAKGKMTQTVMSTVVLKDVFVVLLLVFSLPSRVKPWARRVTSRST